MKINICAVIKELDGRRGFDFTVLADKFLPEDLGSLFVDEVNVNGEVVNVGDVLLLEGCITATLQNSCGRCLEPLTRAMEIRFTEKVFSSTAEGVEEDVLVYDSDVLDISQLVSELLLLEQPINLLCCDDCKGLCPECGINLNLSSCGCLVGSIDPRLLALQQLLKNEQNPKA